MLSLRRAIITVAMPLLSAKTSKLQSIANPSQDIQKLTTVLQSPIHFHTSILFFFLGSWEYYYKMLIISSNLLVNFPIPDNLLIHDWKCGQRETAGYDQSEVFIFVFPLTRLNRSLSASQHGVPLESSHMPTVECPLTVRSWFNSKWISLVYVPDESTVPKDNRTWVEKWRNSPSTVTS